MNKVLGIVLIVLGIIGLGWGALTFTTQKKVVDIGPIQATKQEHHSVPVPPIAGALLLVGGVFLVSRP
jgi:drug/metabolite transporter (DMT)-like permease